jgi:hypothetical protein
VTEPGRRGGRSAIRASRRAARQQRFAAVGGTHGLDKVRGRVDRVELRRLEERVERGRDLRPEARLGAVVVLAADNRATDGAIGGVVIERDASIDDERLRRSQLATA